MRNMHQSSSAGTAMRQTMILRAGQCNFRCGFSRRSFALAGPRRRLSGLWRKALNPVITASLTIVALLRPCLRRAAAPTNGSRRRIQHEFPGTDRKPKRHDHQDFFPFTSAFISPFSSFAGNGGHDFSRPYGQYGMLEEQDRPSHRPEPETRKKSHRFRTAARNRFNGVPSIRIIKKRSSVPGSQPGEACRSGD